MKPNVGDDEKSFSPSDKSGIVQRLSDGQKAVVAEHSQGNDACRGAENLKDG